MRNKEMLTSQTVKTIEKQLRYIAAVIRERGREVLIDEGLTPPQFVTLQWVLDKEGITISELASKMFLAFSTTTDLIDRMENKGLVKRIKDEQDKRVVRIHLQEKGEKTIYNVIKKRQIFLNDKLEELSDPEIDNLQHGLTSLYNLINGEI